MANPVPVPLYPGNWTYHQGDDQYLVKWCANCGGWVSERIGPGSADHLGHLVLHSERDWDPGTYEIPEPGAVDTAALRAKIRPSYDGDTDVFVSVADLRALLDVYEAREPGPVFPPVEYKVPEGRDYECAVLPVVRTIEHEPDYSAYAVEDVGSYAGVQPGINYTVDGKQCGGHAWTGPFIDRLDEDGRRRPRDVMHHEAMAKAYAALAVLQPAKRTVRVKRVQVTLVEVDSAYSLAEAEHAAFQQIDSITDAEWAAGIVGYRSGFCTRSLPMMEGGTPVV